MDLPSEIRSIVPYDDLKRIYADANPSDDVGESPNEDDVARAKDARRKLLGRRLKSAREGLTRTRVIGFAHEDGKSVVLVHRQAACALSRTPSPREVEAPPLSADLASAEIPF